MNDNPFFHSLDKLEMSTLLNSNPVQLTEEFGNDTYYTDVTISLTSKKSEGRFKLEYSPGM